MGTKAKRLMVRGNITDNTWLYCGGPKLDEAMDGLCDLLRDGIEILFQDFGHGEIDDLQLKIVEMTDEEVESLPEM